MDAILAEIAERKASLAEQERLLRLTLAKQIENIELMRQISEIAERTRRKAQT
jgi:hypothetical protein